MKYSARVLDLEKGLVEVTQYKGFWFWKRPFRIAKVVFKTQSTYGEYVVGKLNDKRAGTWAFEVNNSWVLNTDLHKFLDEWNIKRIEENLKTKKQVDEAAAWKEILKEVPNESIPSPKLPLAKLIKS